MQDQAEVKISRRGSVSIHIPSSSNHNNTTTTTPGFNPSSSTYRERARLAIESTLSPGSEFSFGDTEYSSRSISSGASSSSVNLSERLSSRRAATSTQWKEESINNSRSGSSNNSNNSNSKSVNNSINIPRSSAAIRYVNGVGKSTVSALDRLEDALARTSSLSGTWAHTNQQDEEERAAVREIAYLRTMQEQLSSASSKLRQTNTSTPSHNSHSNNTNPLSSHRVAAKLAAASPGQVELDQTLSRLNKAATREGVLRMENLRLRKEQAQSRISGTNTKKKTTTTTRTKNSNSTNRTSRNTAHMEELLAGGARRGITNDSTSANLFLKCAILEEKIHATEQRARVAEASTEAIAHQLRKLRESKAVSSLTSESELYQRIEQGLMSVEEVAAPLAALERKAAFRHETITSHLTSIDIQVRTENAELQARVEQLENTNIELKHVLSSRPTRKNHMDVLRRESALMREIVRLRSINSKFIQQKKKKKTNVRVTSEIQIVSEGKTGATKSKSNSKSKSKSTEGKKEGKSRDQEEEEDDDDEDEDEKEEYDAVLSMDRTSMRVDRTLRAKNVLELSNAISSLDQYGFRKNTNNQNTVPLSKEAARVGWASTSLIVAIMKRYNLDVARGISPLIESMDRDASSLIGMQESLQKIQNMVDQSANVKVGLDNDEKEEEEKNDAFNLGNVSAIKSKDLNLEELETNLKIMLNQRRILAFEQTHPEKVLHDVLLHFQMIVKAENLQNITPNMQEMLIRLKNDRSSLDELRLVFGMTQTGQDINLCEKENKELVDLIRAYAIKQGITPFDGGGGGKRNRHIGGKTKTVFVPSNKVKKSGRGSSRNGNGGSPGNTRGSSRNRNSLSNGATLPRTFSSVLNEIQNDKEGLDLVSHSHFTTDST